MTRDKQFRNSKGWKANKSSYWYNLGAKQEFIKELFIPLRKLHKMFGEQNRGRLWSRFGRYSYYLKCERVLNDY